MRSNKQRKIVDHPSLSQFRIGANSSADARAGYAGPGHGADCDELLAVVEDLELFVGDIHVMYRSRTAAQLLFALHAAVAAHLVEEAEVLKIMEQADRAPRLDPPGELVNRTWGEYQAMRKLLPPVLRGLRCITQNCLPGDLSRFIFDAVTLAEFCRMHVRFKRDQLYPAMARLKGRRRNLGMTG